MNFIICNGFPPIPTTSKKVTFSWPTSQVCHQLASGSIPELKKEICFLSSSRVTHCLECMLLLLCIKSKFVLIPILMLILFLIQIERKRKRNKKFVRCSIDRDLSKLRDFHYQFSWLSASQIKKVAKLLANFRIDRRKSRAALLDLLSICLVLCSVLFC